MGVSFGCPSKTHKKEPSSTRHTLVVFLLVSLLVVTLKRQTHKHINTYSIHSYSLTAKSTHS